VPLWQKLQNGADFTTESEMSHGLLNFSVTQVQQEYQHVHDVFKVPSHQTMHRWCHIFEETGSIAKKHCGGRKHNAEVKD
jgi:hypothetical protein